MRGKLMHGAARRGAKSLAAGAAVLAAVAWWAGAEGGLRAQEAAPPPLAAPAAETQPVKVGEYWIGVACSPEPLSKTLRAQLGLEENQGLAVLSVVPDSPAAKAGIQEDDILLTAADKPLATIQDLVDAVEASKEQEMSVVLLRKGARLQVSLTPAKRPAEAQPRVDVEVPDWLPQDPNARRAWEWLRRWQQGGDRRMVVPRPGLLLPHAAPLVAPLPEDMAVTIVKEGDAPARITVKQGDKTWEVTQDRLGELPEEVRGHVEGLLGMGPPTHFDALFLERPQATPAQPPRIRAVPAEPGADRRFQDIQEQLQKLREAVEALEKRLSAEGDK